MDFSKFTSRIIYILREGSISKNWADRFTKGPIQYRQKTIKKQNSRKNQNSLQCQKSSNKKKSLQKKPNDLYDRKLSIICPYI